MKKNKSASIEYKKRRVLIVDDNKDFATNLKDILELHSYVVEVAHSTDSGLKKIKNFDAQVTLIDVRLGRGSGIDLLAKIKRIRTQTICVMITAYAATDTAVKALQAGAYDYLQKPLNPDDLLATLDRCFEKLYMEEAIRESERMLKVKSRIKKIFLVRPGNEMYAEVLNVILETMQSKHGVFGYIDKDNGALVTPSKTNVWDECDMAEKNTVFPPETWSGVWGRALKEKKTVCANVPGNVPEGHIRITRTLVVPINYHDNLVGMIMVSNKLTNYGEKDQALLETIADHIAPVLYTRLEKESHEKKLKQRVNEKETLNIISQLFLTSNDLKPVYNELPKILAKRFRFSTASIELYDEENQNMVFVGSEGIENTEPMIVPVDQTISGAVVVTGKA